MVEASKPPLKVWAVSDGRAGIEAQVVGLSEAIARLVPCEVTVKRVGWTGSIGRLPWWLNLLPKRWLTPESGIPRNKDDDWPDLWIAAGRATLPLSIRAKRWSGGKTYVVQIQDPRVPPTEADQMIKAVRANGGSVWHVLAKNEGHVFRKKENEDYYFWTSIMFWRKTLLGQ